MLDNVWKRIYIIIIKIILKYNNKHYNMTFSSEYAIIVEVIV